MQITNHKSQITNIIILFVFILLLMTSCAKDDDCISNPTVKEKNYVQNTELFSRYDSVGIYHNMIMNSFYNIVYNEDFDTNQTFSEWLYNTLKSSFISNGITVENCFQEEVDAFLDFSQLYESIFHLDLSDTSDLSMEAYFDNIRRLINIEMSDSLTSLEKYYLNIMFSVVETAYNKADDLFTFYYTVETELNKLKCSMMFETWKDNEHKAIISFVIMEHSFELVRSRFLAISPYRKKTETLGLNDKQKQNLWAAAHITADVIGGTIGAVFGATALSCTGPLGSLIGAAKGACKFAVAGTGTVSAIKACVDFKK